MESRWERRFNFRNANGQEERGGLPLRIEFRG